MKRRGRGRPRLQVSALLRFARNDISGRGKPDPYAVAFDMCSFAIEDHTADVRLRVSGNDQAELFREALRGMNEIITAEKTPAQGSQIVAFSLLAPDAESLLVDFLNEALFIMQTRKVAATEVQFSVLNATHAKGCFVVKPVDGFAEDIKAATYHDVRIQRKRNAALETTIVFDI